MVSNVASKHYLMLGVAGKPINVVLETVVMLSVIYIFSITIRTIMLCHYA
jgi:hypothetical protein